MDIRHLYKPVQPTTPPTGDVAYFEFLPEAKLQNFIYCYWQLKTTKTLTSQYNYRVVADGCIDIFFELANPRENFVMGFCKRYTEFPLHNSFNYIGVRFLPTMFPQLFKINASELSNRFEKLNVVIPPTAKFISDTFHDDLSVELIKDLFDKYFIQYASTVNFDYDTRLYEAIEKILQNSGVLSIEKDLNTGISARQLRRIFEFYIGDTPKIFTKIVRFQNILRVKPSAQSLKQNKLFYDVGYYDQAHFIKDFTNLYGVTPSKAFGR